MPRFCRTACVALILLPTLLGGTADSQTFATPQTTPVPVHPNAVVAGDFNGDGIQDLAVPSYSPNNVTILLGNGNGGFGGSLSFAAGSGPRHAAVADFDNDGFLDVAVANQDSSDVSVLRGLGDGRLGTQRRVPVGLLPFHVAAGDLNGDGRSDLVVTNSGSNSVSILLGDGTGVDPACFFVQSWHYKKALLINLLQRTGHYQSK